MSDLRGIQSIRVSVDKLLETLKENKQQHIEEYQQALDGWTETVNEMIREIQTSDDPEELEEQIQALQREKVDRPSSHVDDYNQVIGMLEMTEDEQIELSQSEYNKLVLDEWRWKSELQRKSSKYS